MGEVACAGESLKARPRDQLLSGPAGSVNFGGQSTWANVKAQAASLLGLQLRDIDVTNIPMLATDPYGKFLPGPARGLPQYVTATGLVGRSILEGLLTDPSVQSVHVLGRRNPRVAHARITFHIVDLSKSPQLPPVDEVYIALGTTIKVAGSQAAFRAVDFDANLAVARAALAQSFVYS